MMPVNAKNAVTARTPGVDLTRCVTVAIDVGKFGGLAGVEDFTGQQLCRPIGFAMNRAGIAQMIAVATAAMPALPVVVGVGVEACGHYHQPVTAARGAPGRLGAGRA